jgi:hypothetical protein
MEYGSIKDNSDHNDVSDIARFDGSIRVYDGQHERKPDPCTDSGPYGRFDRSPDYGSNRCADPGRHSGSDSCADPCTDHNAGIGQAIPDDGPVDARR